MRNSLFIFTLFCFLYSCAPLEPTATLSGNWDLQYYEEIESGDRYERPEHVPKAVKISFTDRGKGGKFEGETIVNPLYGKYRLFEDGTMEVSEIAGNLQRDPDWAARFWKSLESASSFERRGDELYLYYDNDRQRMMFLWNADLD